MKKSGSYKIRVETPSFRGYRVFDYKIENGRTFVKHCKNSVWVIGEIPNGAIIL